MVLQSFKSNEDKNIRFNDINVMASALHNSQTSFGGSKYHISGDITCFIPAASDTIPKSSGKCEYNHN